MAFEFAPISDRIARIREKRSIFTSGVGMSINSERTKIYTDYYKAHENEYPILKRAGPWSRRGSLREFWQDRHRAQDIS